jgi:hypothetical protein
VSLSLCFVECLFLYDDAFLFITTLMSITTFMFITTLLFMTTLSFFSFKMFKRCVFPGQWTPPGLGKVKMDVARVWNGADGSGVEECVVARDVVV